MIYVDCDASYDHASGWAGIAYVSTVLGNKRQVVRCECSTEAEMRAVLMAVRDHRGHRPLTVRSDSNAAVRPDMSGTSRRPIRALRKALLMELDHSFGWQLKRTTREKNVVAHTLARSARGAAERVFAA